MVVNSVIVVHRVEADHDGLRQNDGPPGARADAGAGGEPPGQVLQDGGHSALEKRNVFASVTTTTVVSV